MKIIIKISILFILIIQPYALATPNYILAIKQFDHKLLKQLKEDSLPSPLTIEDLIKKALIVEGLISYYEVTENQNKILGLSKEGVNICNTLLSMNPDSSEGHRLLSRFLAKQLNWTNGHSLGPIVVDEVNRSVKLDPNNPNARLAKISIYLYSPPVFGGDPAKARKMLQELVNELPDYENGHVNLAIAYSMNGEKKKAKQLFKEILIKNPYNLTAQKELKKLR